MNISSLVNSTVNWFDDSVFIRGILNNPTYVALLLTAIIIIVISSLFTLERKKLIKGSIYIFIATIMILFLHYRIVARSASKISSRENVRDIFASIEQSQSITPPSAIPVIPAEVQSI